MVDPNTPFGGDPLDDRLRATFAAERADVERRHLAHDTTSTRSRPLLWVPFAAVAALAILAGFFFIGNRVNDQAVELDVAGQTGQADWEVPNPDTSQPSPVGSPTPVAAMPLSANPPFPELFPYQTGVNWCAQRYNPTLAVVWNPTGELVPAQLMPEVTGTYEVRRRLEVGTPITLVPQGCTAAQTSAGPMVWYEIAGERGTANEWINGQFLVSERDYQGWLDAGIAPSTPSVPPAIGTPSIVPPVAGLDDCGSNAQVIFPLRFVWGIQPDDPDGGLVAHTTPGVDAPVTRVLELDEIAALTGRCEVLPPATAVWFELRAEDGSLDWVSGNFLAEGAPACLVGEQYGTRSRSGAEPFFHTVQEGDRLGSIAQLYNVPVDSIIRANPALNPNLIIFGERLYIPDFFNDGLTVPEQIFGPVQGLAIVDGDRVAFAASTEMVYRWYDAEAVRVNAPCFDEGPVGPICIFGTIGLGDLQSPEPTWVGQGPITAQRMRRLVSVTDDANIVEVLIEPENEEPVIGFIDTRVNPISEGACAPSSSDLFAEAPCTASESEVVVGTTERGSVESTADHVHDLRVQQTETEFGPCTRVVIEFGTNADGSQDAPAAALPLMTIEKRELATRVLLPPWTFAGPGEPSRTDFPGGMALIATTDVSRPTVEVLYGQQGPVNVWFLEDPARVIVDYLNPPSPPGQVTGPFGGSFVVRQPIQQELTGRGLAPGEPIVVDGFGRPFEAQGLYRIYQVDRDVNPNEYFATPRQPIFEQPFQTTGWLDGYGSFSVQLPDLAPGTYIALFGESPPSDEIDFIGSGQLFRIADPNDVATSDYPLAVLLPDVRIASS